MKNGSLREPDCNLIHSLREPFWLSFFLLNSGGTGAIHVLEGVQNFLSVPELFCQFVHNLIRNHFGISPCSDLVCYAEIHRIHCISYINRTYCSYPLTRQLGVPVFTFRYLEYSTCHYAWIVLSFYYFPIISVQVKLILILSPF